MNPGINKYVNYLLDNKPSPFCEYILYKELLRESPAIVQEAYEWAKRFKLYTELRDEQYPDGSYGGFGDQDTRNSKGRHIRTTIHAIMRMTDLALGVGDPIVDRTLALCAGYLSHDDLRGVLPEISKNNTTKEKLTRRAIIQRMGLFLPREPRAVELRRETARRFEQSCANGRFDMERWRSKDISPVIGDFSYETVFMLSYGDVLSDDTQRMLLRHEWETPLYDVVKLTETMTPDEPLFHFWLLRLEGLKDFGLFNEFTGDKITSHLYRLCDRLIDRHDKVPIFINRYHYHYGQYSESWTAQQAKKNDLLLRLTRILDKCESG